MKAVLANAQQPKSADNAILSAAAQGRIRPENCVFVLFAEKRDERRRIQLQSWDSFLHIFKVEMELI